ncbi:MAG: DUF5131 family protein [Sedimentisphaerales bacterium]|nr:DUF5131 family protein [Sedimentisphaerales bacterium]
MKWWNKSWNPVTGCTQISDGCKNCYAKSLANRFNGGDFSVKMHPDRLEMPLHWKKPQRIFVNSMSDLFHKNVPCDFIHKVLTTIWNCPQHTFLICTKRPENFLNFLRKYNEGLDTVPIPLRNLHLGVTAENQEEADKRIPILLQIPATKRFVSVEPMLSPVLLKDSNLDWVIVGCESGTNRRHIDNKHILSVIEQCKAQDIPIFVKQLEIDGKVTDDVAKWPAELRVREYP